MCVCRGRVECVCVCICVAIEGTLGTYQEVTCKWSVPLASFHRYLIACIMQIHMSYMTGRSAWSCVLPSDIQIVDTWEAVPNEESQ